MKDNNAQTRFDVGWRMLIMIMVFSLLVSGCGNSKPKVYHVGILSGIDFLADIAEGFKTKMTESGYVEGENIVYDVQMSNFDMEFYRSAAQKFVADKVDLIVVFPTEATLEAKAVTQGTDIPVLFAYAVTEDTGIVESVSAPGGNITGVRYPGADIALKRFEIMMEMYPQATRVWIPYQRGYPIVGPELAAIQPAAEAAGVTIIEGPVDSIDELKSTLDRFGRSEDVGFDAILYVPEPLTTVAEVAALINEFSRAHKVPVFGLLSLEDNGAVFGLNVQPYTSGVDAAPLADKILRGTPAGTIPVFSSETYLQIDVKVANEFGVTVPQGLLAQADEIAR